MGYSFMYVANHELQHLFTYMRALKFVTVKANEILKAVLVITLLYCGHNLLLTGLLQSVDA